VKAGLDVVFFSVANIANLFKEFDELMVDRMNSPADALSQLFGYEHAVLFGRARSGLAAFIEIVGGDLPVLMPSNICPSVLSAVLGGGGKPVLVPVSPLSGLADDERMAAALARNNAARGVVMPAHLYGIWSPYPATCRLARERGWLFLENDSMATIAVAGKAAAGDALLVSFGPGKTIDAGGGGAILANDASLAASLAQKAAAWPPLQAADEAVEANLALARRSLRALEAAHLAEPLLQIDIAHLRHGFEESRKDRLVAALAAFRRGCERRRAVLFKWQRALAGLAEHLVLPDEIIAPWRLIGRFRDPARRDQAIAALRQTGIDAGINYPPLTDAHPTLLGDQRHADADNWGDRVINFWLSDDYDEGRIAHAAAIIEKACA